MSIQKTNQNIAKIQVLSYLLVNFDLLNPLYVQLVAKKKTGNEIFPNVNLVLFICQLILYLTIPVK
jgi:hypothetical protein